jgi:predicted DNA-binding transcriptional regulator AlpA
MSPSNSAFEAEPRHSQIAPGDEVAMARHQKYLGTQEICARLGICRHTWHRWVKSGQAPAPAPLPGNPRWSRSDLERFERGRVHQVVAEQRVGRHVRQTTRTPQPFPVLNRDGAR